MARPQNRKREHLDDSLETDIDRPAKRTKTRSEIELEAWESWEYPPEFYDRLSKVCLSHRALQELDRRTRTRRRHPSPPSSPASRSRPISSRTTTSRDLARFARHGGPDLRSLRGYPHPPIDHQSPVVIMSARPSSRSRMTRSMDPASTLPTTGTAKTKKPGPYDRTFELHLSHNLVHPDHLSQEPDLEEVMAAMAVPRPSLSPSKFSDGDFKAFRISHGEAKDESDVMADVIPTILGRKSAACSTARNTVFGNLDPLTDGTITDPKPDIYDGAKALELDPSIHKQLAGHIMPSTMGDKPIAPNFFLEAKGPDGFPSVALRQARYDGAIGSRAMHSLENYGAEESQYPGKAHTFTSTYHDGTLKLYAHHTTAPTTDEGQPEYHMTQVTGYLMTNNRETFVQGATAFRNTRDLAKQYRDDLIHAANARASQLDTSAGQERTTTEMRPAEDSDDELLAGPLSTTETWYEDSISESVPSLRRYSTVKQYEEDSADELANSPSDYRPEDDDSQDSLGIDPPTSLKKSVRSRLGSCQTRPKRARKSLNPPSRSLSTKRRAKRRARQPIDSSRRKPRANDDASPH